MSDPNDLQAALDELRADYLSYKKANSVMLNSVFDLMIKKGLCSEEEARAHLLSIVREMAVLDHPVARQLLNTALEVCNALPPQAWRPYVIEGGLSNKVRAADADNPE